MKYRKLGNSSLDVSVIGLGTWAMGNDFWGRVDDAESIRTIQSAIGYGINLIDTAPAYGNGHSEEVVGAAIRDRRSKVVLATKVGLVWKYGALIKDCDPRGLEEQVDESLRRLKVDTVDLLQIHRHDPRHPLEASLEVLLRQQEKGKVRFIGVSNFDVTLLERARQAADVISLQPHYSMLCRDIENDLLPLCRDSGIGTLGYGSLAGGILSGKFREIPKLPEDDHRDTFYNYFHEHVWEKIQNLLSELHHIGRDHSVPVEQVALNWAIRDGGVTAALVGAKSPQQIESNAASADWDLTDEELFRIEEACREHLDGGLECQ